MKRVLICDDAVFVRKSIREMFETAGYEVVAEAESGEEGVLKYMSYKPDLVIMDLVMKDSGVKAIRKIVELDPQAKVIIVTILSTKQGEVIDAIRAGAMGIIGKPFSAHNLLAEAERVLNKNE